MVIALSISSSAALSSIAVATATTHSSALQTDRNIQLDYHDYQRDTTLGKNRVEKDDALQKNINIPTDSNEDSDMEDADDFEGWEKVEK